MRPTEGKRSTLRRIDWPFLLLVSFLLASDWVAYLFADHAAILADVNEARYHGEFSEALRPKDEKASKAPRPGSVWKGK